MPPALIPSASLGTGRAEEAAKTRYVLQYHYSKSQPPLSYPSGTEGLNGIVMINSKLSCAPLSSCYTSEVLSPGLCIRLRLLH